MRTMFMQFLYTLFANFKVQSSCSHVITIICELYLYIYTYMCLPVEFIDIIDLCNII